LSTWKNLEVINNIISNFFKLKNAVDRDQLDKKKAKQLLSEFRDLVGNDPIEKEIERREREKSRGNYKVAIDQQKSQRKRLEDLNSFFTSLITNTEYTPQQRGFKLEEIFCDVISNGININKDNIRSRIKTFSLKFLILLSKNMA